ncbi:MAG: hypothetical protein OHM77_10550 [Candidatus Nitricoxidivorans perseverans]|uniref:Uncharacterized protein n=1 Tax=Candidatus Nitricoxidivorans perseverans TaxID=2975601 RepID=A0AA49IY61_9PROT|nr:MAG: hypothetical protein OHM77_10550 [Candidatus Nitricoxidivorans perseverans]
MAEGFVLDLRESADQLDLVYSRNEARWKTFFIDWLGGLNRRNAGVGWWAHVSAVKNFLSSPLGNRVFQLLALREVVETQGVERLFVLGAHPAQIRATERWAESSGISVRATWRARLPWALPRLTGLRILVQFVRAVRHFGFRRPMPVQAAHPPDLCIFTYVDASLREGSDAFFGTLPERLREIAPGISTMFIAHVQAPLAATLPKLRQMRWQPYLPLFDMLSWRDFAWALVRSLSEALRMRSLRTGDEGWLRPLLLDALRWDMGPGAYFNNLLIYRAARRMAARLRPACFLYPYENKSLEKLLILGLREGFPEIRIVGYQHSSITPRHATLLFAEGEAGATPLPDRIVTAGEVTKDFLERHGRYPEGILVAGCALRQTWGEPFARRASGDGRIRVLLALSSSIAELVRGVRFMMAVSACLPELELGIRPHPEFPLDRLPAGEREWVRSHAKELGGTPLADNLQWCDVVAYASSTVAIEALMRGRPVVHFPAGDIVGADPLIGDAPAFRSKAASAEEFAAACRRWMEMDDGSFHAFAVEGVEYVASYLKAPDEHSIGLFLCGSR